MLERLKKTSLATRVSAAVIALFAIYGAFAIVGLGKSWDEDDHRQYGQWIVEWWRTRSPDSQALTSPALVFYGGFYDVLGVGLEKLLPFASEVVLHHLLSLAFATAGLVYTALLVRRIAGEWAGFLAVLILATCPRFVGDSHFNPVDIPFAAAYVAAVFHLLQLLEAFPKPKPPDFARFGIAAGLALAIRPGGLLLLAYLAAGCVAWAVATVRKGGVAALSPHAPRLAAWAVATVGIAWLACAPFWPKLLLHPFSHAIAIVGSASRFPWTGAVLFGGRIIPATALPWDYLPTWFFITAPLSLLAGLVLAAVFAGRIREEQRGQMLRWTVLGLALLFPPVYAIVRHATLYDACRHFYFLLPFLAALAALGWREAFRETKTARAKQVVALVLALGVAEPVWWCLRAHPYEYTYFNPLVGGLSGASSRYETDYWGLSYRRAAEWIQGHESEFGGGPVVVMAAGCHLLRPWWTDPAITCESRPDTPPQVFFQFYRWQPPGWSEHEPPPLAEEKIVPGQVPFWRIYPGPGARRPSG